MAKNGFSMSNRVAVEEVTGAKTLTANDCGKHLLINASASANYTITLPTVAEAGEGWNITCLLQTSGSVAKQVTISKASDDSSGVIKLRQVVTSTDAGGQAAARSTVIFNAVELKVGDKVEIVAGTENYYASAFVSGALTGS